MVFKIENYQEELGEKMTTNLVDVDSTNLRANCSSRKLQRKEGKDVENFDIKEAQKLVDEKASNEIFTAQAQIHNLQRLLDFACQKITQLERDVDGVGKQKNAKKVKRTRKVKKSYHGQKMKRELHDLTNKLNKVREENKSSYKNLIREFKHLIKTKEQQKKFNDEKVCLTFSSQNEQKQQRQQNSLPLVINDRIMHVQPKKWVKISFMQENEKKKENLESDDEMDSAEDSGSKESEVGLSVNKIPKSFFHELETQLFHPRHHRNHAQKKVQNANKNRRQKIPKNRFKKLRSKLDDILMTKLDGFVKVDPECLDHEEFDFCDVHEENDQKITPCIANRGNFSISMNIIKDKKYKLKKTQRFAREFDGIEVKVTPAYRATLDKICQRRQYFYVEDEDEDMMDEYDI